MFGILIWLYLGSIVPVMKDYDKLSLETSSFYIYFGKSSSEISNNQNAVIDKIIESVKSHSDKKIYLLGNAGAQKKGDYSHRGGDHLLAGSRAQSISARLIDSGIPSHQIYIFENGSQTAAKFSNNDFVEIYLK